MIYVPKRNNTIYTIIILLSCYITGIRIIVSRIRTNKTNDVQKGIQSLMNGVRHPPTLMKSLAAQDVG